MRKILGQFLHKNQVTSDALKVLTHYVTYKQKYNFLKKSQYWSKEQLEKYQLRELSKLLCHAYENVPYYSGLFDNLGIKPKDIQSLKDFQKLPFLTKQVVKDNLEDFKAKNFPKFKFEYISSGGSTGEPLGLYVERGVAEASLIAFIQTLLDQTDCHFRNKQVHLVGNDNICKYQVFGRIMILSSFYMTDENLPFYVKKLKKLKPRFIVAYPSAITNLAKFMNKNNIESFSSVKTVICSGETIYEWQRKLIEKTFQCRVHAFYNHAEQAVFATTCNYSFYYHVYPQYGITELIGKDGKPITTEGEMGEIVGTGFNNFIFPFIRYKTEDIGVLTNKKCKCGRNYPLLKRIEGRLQEFIVSKTKRYISLTGVYGLVAKCTKNVIDCQFLQETEGELVLNIVKDENYTDEEENLIKNSLQKKFGGEINLKIHYVDQISLTPGGKSKFLIQKLPIEF